MAFRGLKVIYLRDFRNFEIDSLAVIPSNFGTVLTRPPDNTISHQTDLIRWWT